MRRPTGLLAACRSTRGSRFESTTRKARWAFRFSIGRGTCVTDFRGVNQRMHDKTLIVDGEVAITGGRNVADEYYDYNHDYNFRDRDLLRARRGGRRTWRANFAEFWESPLTVAVERLLEAEAAALGAAACRDLRRPARLRERREQLRARSARGARPSERPISAAARFAGVGRRRLRERFAGQELRAFRARRRRGVDAATRERARGSSPRDPHPVPVPRDPDGGFELFERLIDRGVAISIVTNSFASTDNLQAFSGYSEAARRASRLSACSSASSSRRRRFDDAS